MLVVSLKPEQATENVTALAVPPPLSPPPPSITIAVWYVAEILCALCHAWLACTHSADTHLLVQATILLQRGRGLADNPRRQDIEDIETEPKYE